MIEIKLITIGKVKEKYLAIAESEYLKRLSPYVKLDVLELKAEKFTKDSEAHAMKIESDRMRTTLCKEINAGIFLLDERGREFDSVEFAKFIDSGTKIIFVIAGSLGFDADLKKTYKSLSLSRMTFLHEMARVLLLEQIYRGVSILMKKNYHH